MPKLEISSEIIEQAVHAELQQTIRDLFPSGLEYFYPSAPDLLQIIMDAIRYRYVRNRGGRLVEDYADEDLDNAVDQAINKELDS